MNFTLCTVFVIILNFLTMIHPVHISITNLDYFREKNEIQLSIKVYKDDFQLLFYHLYQKDIDFNVRENVDDQINDLNNYLTSHFKLKSQTGKSIELEFQKFDLDDDYLIFYYKSYIDSKTEYLEIINTILFDLYFDQKNMLIFSSDNKELGLMFNFNHEKHTVNLNGL